MINTATEMSLQEINSDKLSPVTRQPTIYYRRILGINHAVKTFTSGQHPSTFPHIATLVEIG